MNNSNRLVAASLFLVLMTGCSTIRVRVESPSPAAQARRVNDALASLPAETDAAKWLRAAQGRGIAEDQRLQSLISAAHAALPKAIEAEPGALAIYNTAVAGIVRFSQEKNFAVLQPRSGAWGFELVRSGQARLDPSQCDKLTEAANVRIAGLQQRETQRGIGVPYVFNYFSNSPFLADQPGVSLAGMSIPATAILTFRGRSATLSFYDTLEEDRVRLSGRRVQLAADFSAPIAQLISRSANRSLDIRSFLQTGKFFPRAGLFQFQPYNANKIPVVFVHGLLSRPEVWTQALNGMMADRTIRQRYQFWFLLYPTGLPIWKSTALLRAELDRYHRSLESHGTNPRLDRIVLIGHSMGGLISSLAIRQGGEKLWRQFSDNNPDAITLSPSARKMFRELIFFEPRKDVGRVIFVATPHRGSQLAMNPVARLASRLIQLPGLIGSQDRMELLGALRDDARDLLRAPATSLHFLKANSPLITSIQSLPLTRTIPYHSIIGDRGRGDSPKSSDGVVPYWSSHLPTATSEKIVPSDHGANENPEAIREMRRILLENLR
ncbi:MAG: esterase/lipase family protein [Terrimicrobiaceae bacterium]